VPDQGNNSSGHGPSWIHVEWISQVSTDPHYIPIRTLGTVHYCTVSTSRAQSLNAGPISTHGTWMKHIINLLLFFFF